MWWCKDPMVEPVWQSFQWIFSFGCFREGCIKARPVLLITWGPGGFQGLGAFFEQHSFVQIPDKDMLWCNCLLFSVFIQFIDNTEWRHTIFTAKQAFWKNLLLWQRHSQVKRMVLRFLTRMCDHRISGETVNWHKWTLSSNPNKCEKNWSAS